MFTQLPTPLSLIEQSCRHQLSFSSWTRIIVLRLILGLCSKLAWHECVYCLWKSLISTFIWRPIALIGQIIVPASLDLLLMWCSCKRMSSNSSRALQGSSHLTWDTNTRVFQPPIKQRCTSNIGLQAWWLLSFSTWNSVQSKYQLMSICCVRRWCRPYASTPLTLPCLPVTCQLQGRFVFSVSWPPQCNPGTDSLPAAVNPAQTPTRPPDENVAYRH